MAKRSSEHQLTRDDDSGGEEQEVKVGMVKADPSVLASRPIKGLPKRKGATPLSTSTTSSNSSSAAPSPAVPAFTGFGTTSAPAPTEAKPEAPRFSGFAGFGAPSTTSSTAASAAAPKPSEAPRFAAFSGFGTTPTATATKTDAPAESKPVEAPRFAAFTAFGSVKPATTSSSAPSAIPPKPEAPVPAAETKPDTTAALTYWTSLRGLNHAFVESVKKAVEADMFGDLGGMFKQYQEFREKVVKDYEDAKASGASDTAKPPESNPAPAKPPFAFGAPGGSKDSPFSFGSSNPSSVSASTSAGASKPSSFGLNFPSSKPMGFGSTDASLVTPAPTPPAQPPSPRKPVSTFNATEDAPPEATPTPSPMPGTPNVFDIATAKNNDAPSKTSAPEEKEKASNPFETAAAKAANPPTTKPAFTFGSGSGLTFGSSTTTKPDAKPFSFNTSNSAGFSGFGNSSAAPTPALSTTATAGSSVPPSSKPFAFTTPLSTPGTPFAFGAGSPKGNTTPRPGGNVGFSFGNSPPRKDTPGFPFGASTSAALIPKSEGGPSDEGKAKEGENENDKPAAEGEAAADGEEVDRAQTAGAGEENEDTLYSARARVLRFYKQAWVGVGIGQFKIKYDRETKKRRILHRLEGTGRVVLNCNLFEEMNPVFESKGLMRFTATDDEGHPMLYRVKVKTEAEAQVLTDAFKDALEAYKADKEA